MAASYEAEQEKLKAAVPALEAFLTIETDKTESVERFVTKVKSITRPTELTPELVHEFIEKLVVSEARYVDGGRVQVVDVYYKGVGMVKGFSPGEMEEAFQQDLERRKQRKTA